jgi:hypothetical protein
VDGKTEYYLKGMRHVPQQRRLYGSSFTYIGEEMGTARPPIQRTELSV